MIDAGPVTTLTSVAVGDSPFTLNLEFGDGARGSVDLSDLVHKRQALAALRTQDEFAKVQVTFHGAGVEWEAGPDFSADALRHLAGL